MLKKKIESLDEVDEGVRSFYTEQDDGTFVLDVDDAETKEKVADFRKRNIELQKKVKKQEEEQARIRGELDRFKDIDPEKYARMAEALEDLEAAKDKKLIDSGNAEEVFNRRIATIQETHNKDLLARDERLKVLDSELGTLKQRHSAMMVDRDIQAAINRAGMKVRAGAMEDVLHRSRQTWKLNDKGEMEALDSQGVPIFGGEGKPMTMTEYVQGLLESAPHLFEGSSGGGAGGGDRGAERTPGRTIENDPVTIGRNLEEVAKGTKHVS